MDLISGEKLKTGLLSRMVAWKVLQAVAAGAYADVALERSLRKYQLSSLDRNLAMEIAYGAIRQRYLLDCWIDCYGKVSSLKQPPMLRWLLHLGLYQLLFMERIPPAAAINLTVELAKKSKLVRLASVVNGVLRAAQRAIELGNELPEPTSLAEKLAQKYSFPFWLAENLINWKGLVEAESFAKASNQKPTCDLRVNRLRATPQSVKALFDEACITSSFIDSCPDGIEVSAGLGDMRKWPGFQEGFWSVQDRSAQLITPLLNPQPGHRILDACSAPGGKSTHLAELINNQGEILAIDRSPGRLGRVSTNADRLGCDCIKTLAADSSLLLKQKPSLRGTFNRILLDAPCSGLGTLSRHPDARWRISPARVDELVALQSKLLEGIFPLLSPGGRMIYSTCTIHPEENNNLIMNFLSIHPSLKLVDEKHIWPDVYKHGDGFYAAVLELM